jgi:hypothetical protein
MPWYPSLRPVRQSDYSCGKAPLPPRAQLAEDVDLSLLANKYELTGSSIVSIIHFASLQAIARGSEVIMKKDLVEGIQREYEKEERVFTE